jgi:glycopeptide antibiotics resistance protein
MNYKGLMLSLSHGYELQFLCKKENERANIMLRRSGVRTFFMILFVLYLIVLIKLTLVKGSFTVLGFHFSGANGYTSSGFAAEWHYSNFTPFRSIGYYLSGNEPFYVCFINLTGNIFLFLPYGFLLPLLFKKCSRFLFLLLICIATSFAIETLQFITRAGIFDVDDILLNAAGGVLGYGFLQLFLQLMAKVNIGITEHRKGAGYRQTPNVKPKTGDERCSA